MFLEPLPAAIAVTHPVFELPEYTIGPYTMRIVPTPRHQFSDRRRIVEHDWTQGHVRMDCTLEPSRALECLFHSLVTCIHYRSGLNDHCDEEAFTHSLATGLVELARHNPRFMAQLHRILERQWRLPCVWSDVLEVRHAPPAFWRPQEVVFRMRRKRRTCVIRWRPAGQWRHPGYYAWYLLKQGVIEIDARLHGPNLALVTLHEVAHFFHESLGLTSRSKERDFKAAHVAMLPALLRHNPHFWAWWLHTAAESPALGLARAA